MLTPIQLANYIAAVANGGVRYKTQMVKSVKNSENGNSLFDVTPEVMYDIDMSEENYKAVINGMKKVSKRVRRAARLQISTCLWEEKPVPRTFPRVRPRDFS